MGRPAPQGGYLVPFPRRSFDFLLPSFSRRGWGRFFGDRRTPLNPPSERGKENDATFLETALVKMDEGGPKRRRPRSVTPPGQATNSCDGPGMLRPVRPATKEAAHAGFYLGARRQTEHPSIRPPNDTRRAVPASASSSASRAHHESIEPYRTMEALDATASSHHARGVASQATDKPPDTPPTRLRERKMPAHRTVR